MNITILKKCLEELQKETPRLDYVMGMMETLIATQEISVVGLHTYEKKPLPFSQPAIKESLDESDVLNAEARAAFEKSKTWIETSTEIQ